MLRGKRNFRTLEAEDAGWLYAAYRKGGLRDIAPDMVQRWPTERGEIMALLNNSLSLYDEHYILTGTFTDDGSQKEGPVALALVNRTRSAWIIEGMSFFPWASKAPRTRVSDIASFLYAAGANGPALFYSTEKTRALYEFMARLKIVRMVGKIYKVKPDGHAYVYQVR